MTAATALRDAEQALQWHRERCDTCRAGRPCAEGARLQAAVDRLWLAQINSLSTGRVG